MYWQRCMPLVMFCLSGTSILARPYYVDPAKGNAGADGSAQAPLRSLSKLAGKLKPGDTVCLAAGPHTEQVSLTASGTRQNPIVIRNWGRQRPIVESAFNKCTFGNYTWKLDGACNVVVEGLTFRNCSPALMFVNGGSDNVIRGNEFLDCPAVAQGGATAQTRMRWFLVP